MKHCALLSWQYENYGTLFQCYALGKLVQDMGYSATHIRYNPDIEKLKTSRLKLLFNPVKLMLAIYNKFFVRRLGYGICQYERHIRFESFRNTFVLMSDDIQTDIKFNALNTQFDAFICGSDQIWTPLAFSPRYFLDFVHDDSKKIAYAPSFGQSVIRDRAIAKKMFALVDAIPHLSVREKTGARLIRQHLGKDVPVVLDPTLLLTAEDWKKVENTAYKTPGNYIFCYFLGKNERYWKAISRFAKEYGLKIVLPPVFQKDFSRSEYAFKDIGPAEFIRLLENARFVCTDSFHGTVFSMLFKKQFATFLRFKETARNNQNSRVFNILETLNLQERLFSKANGLEKLYKTAIDYTTVYSLLATEKEKSLSYLKNALQSATGGRADG